jgi:hypothetical protein
MPSRRQQTIPAAAIIVLALILASAFGGFNLVIFFLGLAIAQIFVARGEPSIERGYNYLHGILWMLVLALFFATHIWIWFLLGAILSGLLGSQRKNMLNNPFILSLINKQTSYQQPPPTPYYQPPQQQTPYYQPSQQQPDRPYEQGYQTPQQHSETYEEGRKQYPYNVQAETEYEQPQAEYPQAVPPGQQPPQ